MSDFRPVLVERGDGKEFWQPQCDGDLLWRSSSFYEHWQPTFPGGGYGRLVYRFRWYARLKGKKEAKRRFSRRGRQLTE